VIASEECRGAEPGPGFPLVQGIARMGMGVLVARPGFGPGGDDAEVVGGGQSLCRGFVVKSPSVISVWQ
jgi:hypothetical protein